MFDLLSFIGRQSYSNRVTFLVWLTVKFAKWNQNTQPVEGEQSAVKEKTIRQRAGPFEFCDACQSTGNNFL